LTLLNKHPEFGPAQSLRYGNLQPPAVDRLFPGSARNLASTPYASVVGHHEPVRVVQVWLERRRPDQGGKGVVGQPR
jgi:hypothetical protein